MDSLGKESIDLSAQEEDHAKIVKEDKENKQVQGPCKDAEKMCYKKRKEGEINFHEHRCYDGTKPAITEADLLVRNNHIDDLKEHIPGDQTAKKTTQPEDEAASRDLA